MNIQFPDKKQIAEMLGDGETFELPDGLEAVELAAMGMKGLKLAIEEFPLAEYKSMEELIGNNPNDLDPSTFQKKNVPSVMLTCDERGPHLYLRVFNKEGYWLGEVKWDLMKATGYFAGEAHNFVAELLSDPEKLGLGITHERFEGVIIRKTADLLKDAFNKLKGRIEIFERTFLEEIAWKYLERWNEDLDKFMSLQGTEPRRMRGFAKVREMLKKKQEDEIRSLHANNSSETQFNRKKQLLALHYTETFEHWKEMQRMQLGGRNWRRYVKAGDMSDVTDDLIEQFERGTDISGLALEHAARRAEFYNIYFVKKQRLEKRQMGIRDSGYSRSRLFELKKEGKKLLGKTEMSQSTPP